MIVVHGMNSPNVTKVLLMLEACGLAYELRHVAVFKGEQFAPDFLALNPLAKVPVIEDPKLGQPLAESGAILLWLAEREGRFLPASQPARAEAIQWLMVQMANIGPMLGQVNHFQLARTETPQDYARERFRAVAARLYRLLDERLQSREWIAGGEYSVADMAIHPWAHYLERHGFAAEAHPALVAWRARIDERPDTQRALARSNEAFGELATRTRRAASAEDLDRFFGRAPNVPAADFSAVVKM